MNEFINLAEQSGMSREKGEAVAAGLFAILQEEMDPNQYREITSKVPEFDSMAQHHREENGSGDRGLGSSILGMITKQNSQGNNGGMEYLINTLKKHKVTIAELIIFIPLALWLLKREFGIDVFHLFGGSKPSGAAASKPSNNGGLFGSSNNGKSNVGTGSPSSSLAGTNVYYNQLFSGSNGDGRSAAPPTVVVPSYDVATPNAVYAPSYPAQPNATAYNPYGSNTSNGSAYAAASFPVPPNNQYNPSGSGVYVPNYPVANNNQSRANDPYNQQPSDGSVYVPNYNQNANNNNNNNNVYRPPNAGYNNQF